MRILLVDDDAITVRGIGMILKSANAVVDHSDTGEEALELARHYDYDLLILDLMLPDIDGYEVIRRLRAAKREIPVFIVSGLSRPQAKVKGLSLGADDFLAKPFDNGEFLARVNAIVRRSKGFRHSVLTAGPIQINGERQEVTVSGSIVHLTSKEYAILELMVLRKGMVLTKEAFLNHLYGGMDEPEGKIIDVFVCKLRKKLAEFGADDLITTVWGRGYALRDTLPQPAPRRAGHEVLASIRSDLTEVC